MAKYKAMTQEWLDAWKEKIATSGSIRRSPRTGRERLDHREPRSGEGDPGADLLFTDYWHGDVRDFLICDKAKAETAKFVMSGD